MRRIFLFSALLIIAYGQAEATYNIKDIAKRVNFNMPSNVKISTDSTISVGSILYTKSMDVGGSAPAFTCDSSSKNRYTTAIAASEVPGVTGTMSKPAYETGISGIGYQISDLFTGSVYGMIPMVAGSIPVPGAIENTSYCHWLIKTGTTDLSQSPTNSNVSFHVADNDYKATMPSSLLLLVNMEFVSSVPRENPCEITSTRIVSLSGTDKVTPLSTLSGSKVSKEKSFILNINREQRSTGNTIYYWFNPRSSIDGTSGVLLNSDPTSSGGAQSINTIIKEDGIPVNFYDYETKSFVVDANKLNKEISLTADYYRTTDDIIIDTVRGLLEVVIQEE